MGHEPVLVYLYGPPVVGKLTVARQLAELSGLALFHNHLTVNAITPVFPIGSDPFIAVVHRLRLDVFETAASVGESLIFTNSSLWSGSDGRRHFAEFAGEADRRVRAAGGRTLFVQITAPLAVLQSRLGSEDRSQLGKLTDVRRLQEFLDGYDLSPLHQNDIQLDTGRLDPGAAARAIHAALTEPPDLRCLAL